MRSLHHRVEILEAQLKMIRESGASPRGELPPSEYLDALERTVPGQKERIEQVRRSHSESRGPPEWAGPPSNPGNGGDQS